MSKAAQIPNNVGNESDFFHKKPTEIDLLNKNQILNKEIVFLDDVSKPKCIKYYSYSFQI